MLLVENFIPPEEVERVRSRAALSRDTDEWTLAPLDKKYELWQRFSHSPLYFYSPILCVLSSVY